MAAAFAAILGLVAAAAGVGFAAAQIGSSGIKDNAITSAKIKKNAVTSKKVKNGSLKASDLVKLEKQKKPVFSNGGQGDCLWQSPIAPLPTTGRATYRKDRDGRVILTGVAQASDAPGGDADCDTTDAGQGSDGIAFILPSGYVPAKSQYLSAGIGILIIAGPAGFNGLGFSLPPGAVFTPTSAVILDGVEFDSAGSKVVMARTAPPRPRRRDSWKGEPLKSLATR